MKPQPEISYINCFVELLSWYQVSKVFFLNFKSEKYFSWDLELDSNRAVRECQTNMESALLSKYDLLWHHQSLLLQHQVMGVL